MRVQAAAQWWADELETTRAWSFHESWKIVGERHVPDRCGEN